MSREEPGPLRERCVPSPVGDLRVVAQGHALRYLLFPTERHDPVPRAPPAPPDDPVLDEAARQLDEYFAGTRRAFDLPLSTPGTPFQQRVWAALAKLPYGAQVSYLELSQSLGDARAVRAVGRANGQNPLSIVIPCHRVLGADGSLVGFGGGLPTKRWLLDHEARVLGRPPARQGSLFPGGER